MACHWPQGSFDIFFQVLGLDLESKILSLGLLYAQAS